MSCQAKPIGGRFGALAGAGTSADANIFFLRCYECRLRMPNADAGSCKEGGEGGGAMVISDVGLGVNCKANEDRTARCAFGSGSETEKRNRTGPSYHTHLLLAENDLLTGAVGFCNAPNEYSRHA